jgi:hypothetical protein
MKFAKHFFVVLILLIFIQKSQAQSTVGFLKRKNQIAFDAFNAAYFGIYGLEYGHCFSKHFMLKFSFGIQHKSYDGIEYSSGDGNGSTLLYSGTSTIDAKRVSLSFIYNSQAAGLNLPIGYYAGFSIKKIFATVYNPIPAGKFWGSTYDETNATYDYYLNHSQLNFDEKVRTLAFTIILGKNYYLSNGITLDLSFETGFAIYTFKYINYVMPPNSFSNYYDLKPYYTNDDLGNSFSTDNPPTPFKEAFGDGVFNNIFLSGKHDSKSYYYTDKSSLSGGAYSSSFVGAKIVFLPSIKLGYIF